jgi:hypothetical protein
MITRLTMIALIGNTKMKLQMMHKLYKYNEFSNYIVAFTKLMMKNLVSVKQKVKKVNIHYYYILEIYRCSYH